MKKHFSEQLAGLRELVLRMGGLVEQMTRRVVQALVERNVDLLAEVRSMETQVNQLHIEIDEACIELIALRQPTAVDLRFIAAAMKINTDMERIGDQAINITERAEWTILRDDTVDQLKDQVFRELLTFMMADPTTIPRAMDLILVSRHLERIADHTTNICEDVIFMVKGKDVRHQGPLA
ncbi:MAG: transcriptional repressor for high-affinity phosphate uptake (modular protein) [Deltaproteobacteria bacterium]|nr:transcriptional repressor for high-affinity phosphate uptake (modular protein) [Deltaproteobacteria bacterium]